MDTHVDRWLILEQESDRSLWRSDSCDHLFWNSSTLRPESRLGLPRHIPTEREICILFLPVRHGTSILPETFSNRSRWQWNVWCHYGRDITMAELKSRWATYERLSAADKSRLSMDGSRPPLPFSRSMPQPWTDYFRQIKESMQGKAPSRDDFLACLKGLQDAWDLAKGAQGTQVYVNQAKEAMPAVLAAQYLLDSLPILMGWDAETLRETIEKALSICQQSGLMAMANRKEQFSKRVRDAYRHLGFILLRLHVILNHHSKPTLSAGDLESLRAALRSFLKVAKTEAEHTTKALSHHT